MASSITPPVAVAAYAAASIAESPPLMTALFAIRIGMVKFIIPFVFAFYPVLLIVEESGVKFELFASLSILSRLLLVIYLVSSAVLAFDQRRLPAWEIMLRLTLALLVLLLNPLIHWPAAGLALAFLIWHFLRYGSKGRAVHAAREAGTG